MYSTGVFSSVGLELVIEWKQNCRKKKKKKERKEKEKKKGNHRLPLYIL